MLLFIVVICNLHWPRIEVFTGVQTWYICGDVLGQQNVIAFPESFKTLIIRAQLAQMVQYLGLTRVKKRQIIDNLYKQRKVLVCVVKM